MNKYINEIRKNWLILLIVIVSASWMLNSIVDEKKEQDEFLYDVNSSLLERLLTPDDVDITNLQIMNQNESKKEILVSGMINNKSPYIIDHISLDISIYECGKVEDGCEIKGERKSIIIKLNKLAPNKTTQFDYITQLYSFKKPNEHYLLPQDNYRTFVSNIRVFINRDELSKLPYLMNKK